MRILLNTDVKGVGKAGAEVKVAEEVGNDLNARGLCEVLAHDPPGKGTTASTFVKRPEVIHGDSE